MNSYFELSTLGGSFQQAPAVRPEGPGRLIDRTQGAGDLRRVKDLIPAVRRRVGVIALWRQWRRRRTAVRELQTLSDHYLKDIGLDRSQVVSPAEAMNKINIKTKAHGGQL